MCSRLERGWWADARAQAVALPWPKSARAGALWGWRLIFDCSLEDPVVSDLGKAWREQMQESVNFRGQIAVGCSDERSDTSLNLPVPGRDQCAPISYASDGQRSCLPTQRRPSRYCWRDYYDNLPDRLAARWLGASAGALSPTGSGCRNLALSGVYEQASPLFPTLTLIPFC